MKSLSDLMSQREQLIGRITSLQKRVTFGDRTVEYDLTQAQAALQILDREIGASRIAEGGTPPVRSVRLAGRSGY